MENHGAFGFCLLFTILVFQANFMVRVSFMIRGQHQSSGRSAKEREEDVLLSRIQQIPDPRVKLSSLSPHTLFGPLLSKLQIHLLCLSVGSAFFYWMSELLLLALTTVPFKLLLSFLSDFLWTGNNLRAQTQACQFSLRNEAARENHKSPSEENHRNNNPSLSFVCAGLTALSFKYS